MTSIRVTKKKIVFKANMDPMIVFFPSYMFMFFSLKIDSFVSLFSKNQSITIEMEINSHQVSELWKDSYLVVEYIFSGYDFLLDLHSRVSFSRSFLLHLGTRLKASVGPSEPWREIFASPLPGSLKSSGLCPYELSHCHLHSGCENSFPCTGYE